jgi:hypothetical protein
MSSLYSYVSTVTDAEYAEASASLDKALLAAIGLPEDVEIREFENTLYHLSEQIKNIVTDFSLAKLIAVLPNLIMEGAALWEKVEPHVSDSIDRKVFIQRVIRYAYKKNDPDLPVIPEPFETIVEDMIIASIPDMLDNLEAKLNELAAKLKDFFA